MLVDVANNILKLIFKFTRTAFFSLFFLGVSPLLPTGTTKTIPYHTCLLSSAELLHHNCHHQSNDTPLTARNSKWSMWTRSTTHNNNTHRTCLGTRTPRNKLAGTGPDPSRSVTISLLQTGAENVQLQAAGAEARIWPTPTKKIRMFPLCVVSNLLYGVPGFKQGAFVFFFLFHPSYLTSLNQSYFGWNSATEKPHVGFRSNYIQWLWKLLRVPICYVMYFWHLKAGNFS